MVAQSAFIFVDFEVLFRFDIETSRFCPGSSRKSLEEALGCDHVCAKRELMVFDFGIQKSLLLPRSMTLGEPSALKTCSENEAV